jgi:hypothetical protein
MQNYLLVLLCPFMYAIKFIQLHVLIKFWPRVATKMCLTTFFFNWIPGITTPHSSLNILPHIFLLLYSLISSDKYHMSLPVGLNIILNSMTAAHMHGKIVVKSLNVCQIK